MPAVAPQRLSPRLEQVVGLITQGKSNSEIAREMEISEGTVKEHVQRIFAKLDLHNRTAVAIWSIERNR